MTPTPIDNIPMEAIPFILRIFVALSLVLGIMAFFGLMLHLLLKE